MTVVARWGRRITPNVVEVGWDGRLLLFEARDVKRSAKCAVTREAVKRGGRAFFPVGDDLALSLVLSEDGVARLEREGRLLL